MVIHQSRHLLEEIPFYIFFFDDALDDTVGIFNSSLQILAGTKTSADGIHLFLGHMTLVSMEAMRREYGEPRV